MKRNNKTLNRFLHWCDWHTRSHSPSPSLCLSSGPIRWKVSFRQEKIQRHYMEFNFVQRFNPMLSVSRRKGQNATNLKTHLSINNSDGQIKCVERLMNQPNQCVYVCVLVKHCRSATSSVCTQWIVHTVHWLHLYIVIRLRQTLGSTSSLPPSPTPSCFSLSLSIEHITLAASQITHRNTLCSCLPRETFIEWKL